LNRADSYLADSFSRRSSAEDAAAQGVTAAGVRAPLQPLDVASAGETQSVRDAATHCNTPQYIAVYGSILQQTLDVAGAGETVGNNAIYCNIL